MTSVEQDSVASVAAPPLKPHRYPAWLVVFTVLILGAVGFSATLIPPYLEAFVGLRRAEAMIAAGDRAAAEARLLDALRVLPSSKAARIQMAVLLFADPSEARQQRGLDYLRGFTLDKYEWRRVSAALPEKFRSAFGRARK
jgi:hypothetical protein